MSEKFTVECPSCGNETGPISTTAKTVGQHCRCGVTYRIDPDTQEVIEWWEREQTRDDRE